MSYNSDNPIIKLIGVGHMRWQGGAFSIKPRNFSALAFRIRGNAEITIGGSKYTAKENDVLYLPQNLEYFAEYTDTEIIVAHFITLKSDSAPMIRSTENSEQLYKLFLEAQTVWEAKNPAYLMDVMSLIYRILGTVMKSTANIQLPAYFTKGVSLIHSNYKCNDLSVSQICKSIGISETRFRALFKKYYLKSPIEYITDLRIDYAKKLISNGMSVENAAFESGFHDSKYFSRVVKSKLGCTPRELKDLVNKRTGERSND